MLVTRRTRCATVIAAAAGLLTAACGSTSPGTSSTSPRLTTATATTSRPVTKTQHASGAGIGVPQTVRAGGAVLSVAVVRVVDPLDGSGAAVLTGTRAVGVVVRIRNDGPGIYDSSATGDISIVPSTGTTTPVFASRGVCQTPLRDFDNHITTGETRDGCVAFAIESGAKLVAVRFSPHGQPTGRASWHTSS